MDNDKKENKVDREKVNRGKGRQKREQEKKVDREKDKLR